MRVLVTGSNGSLGRVAVTAAREAGHWVRGLDRAAASGDGVYDRSASESRWHAEPDDFMLGAITDKDLLVKAFRHMGDRAPTTVDGIAELSVWDLKKALHVCAIDTALMEEITFAIISGLLMKLRGA